LGLVAAKVEDMRVAEITVRAGLRHKLMNR
jgi:hypothetical protein